MPKNNEDLAEVFPQLSINVTIPQQQTHDAINQSSQQLRVDEIYPNQIYQQTTLQRQTTVQPQKYILGKRTFSQAGLQSVMELEIEYRPNTKETDEGFNR